MGEERQPADHADPGSAEMAEAARRLFAGPALFVKSAAELAQLPDPDLPEIGFAGRSNVGKSSLLNALVGRKSLARASTTPGRTQLLNIFDVGRPARVRLVDMPGYGFAEAPRDMVRNWQRLVGQYLRGRPVLKRALILVDARHGLKPIDHEVMALLDQAALSYQLVLTKADKVKPSDLQATIERCAAEAARHPACHPLLLATSSESGAGIAELRTAVLEAALA